MLILYFFEVYRSFRKRPFLYLAFLLAAGIVVNNLKNPQTFKPQEKYLNQLKKNNAYQGQIVSWPRITNNRTKFILESPDKTKFYVLINTADTTLSKWDFLEIEGSIFAPHEVKNPGVFNFKKYLSNKNISFVLKAEAQDIKVVRGPNYYQKLISSVRKKSLESIKTHFDAEASGILSPILIGQEDDVTKDLKPFFVDTGVMHILVISGLHVGYVVLIFWYFFRIVGFSRKTAAILMMPFLWSYVIITGSNPPVVRAALMATIIILYMLLERSYDIFQSLGLSAFIILLVNPNDLLGASFQLSYAATFEIVYLVPKIQKPFSSDNTIFKFIGMLFCVSLSAQIFTTPLTAYYFNKAPIISLITNLFVVPLSVYIVVGGMIFCALDLIWQPLAIPVAFLTSQLLHIFVEIVKFFSKLPGAGTFAPQPGIYFFIGYYLLALSIPRFNFNRFWKIVSVFSLTAAIAIFLYFSYARKKELTLTFLSLSGDSILIEFPNGKKYLVDTGGSYTNVDVGSRALLPFLRYKNIRRLDKVFITIPDIPHYGTLKKISQEISIGELNIGPMISTCYEFTETMNYIHSKNVVINELWAPVEFSEGESKISLLNPYRRSKTWEENSMVFLIEHRGKKVLLTSDINKRIENLMVEKIKNVDILHIPRGGRNISVDFIKKLSPDYAIISSNREVKTVDVGKTKLFNTHTDGAISVLIGKEIVIKTFLQRRS